MENNVSKCRKDLLKRIEEEKTSDEWTVEFGRNIKRSGYRRNFLKDAAE